VDGLIAGILAGAFTFFDLESKFYIPSKVPKRLSLSLFFWGFIFANGALAGGLFYGLNVNPIPSFLPGWYKILPGWIRALIVGSSYLALIRLKFTTLKVGEHEVPFGIELFYNRSRDWVYEKINEIAKQARYEETFDLAKRNSLDELVTRAKLSTDVDALLNSDQKQITKVWITKVADDP
jgi:hypothetical protein